MSGPVTSVGFLVTVHFQTIQRFALKVFGSEKVDIFLLATRTLRVPHKSFRALSAEVFAAATGLERVYRHIKTEWTDDVVGRLFNKIVTILEI